MKQKGLVLGPAPNYWAYEKGGQLVPAMNRYLNSEPLTQHEITLIRAYLRQWIASPVWDLNPHADAEGKAILARLRDSIADLVSVESIHRWIAAAVAEGLDPL